MARRGKVLAVKLGYNPNSSSLSAEVTWLLFGLLGVSLLLPLLSLVVRLTWRRRSGGGRTEPPAAPPGGPASPPPGSEPDGTGEAAPEASQTEDRVGDDEPRGAAPRRLRPEAFGGIVALERPRALVFVDRAYAASLGSRADGQGAAPERGHPGDGTGQRPARAELYGAPLGAPLEAHLALTHRCPVGCRGCYVDGRPEVEPEWGLPEWQRGLDTLATMGVFHVALGGGESALLPWLPELARHARHRGLVPNLATSGVGVDRLLDHVQLFGQINVSMDGVGASYARVRGVDGFAMADAAVVALRQRTRHLGLNVVLTRETVDGLEDLFAYARHRRLRDVEVLRYKPAGRGARDYARQRLTDDQQRALLPHLLRLARRHRVRVRLDCSLLPMVAWHRPDRRLLGRLGALGCAGGDFLVGVQPDGAVAACSFVAPPAEGPTLHALAAYWGRPDAFGVFRAWRDAAEPCRSCGLLVLCRGGCRAVAVHLAGTLGAPDPECPMVVAWRQDHRRVTVDLGAAA